MANAQKPVLNFGTKEKAETTPWEFRKLDDGSIIQMAFNRPSKFQLKYERNNVFFTKYDSNLKEIQKATFRDPDPNTYFEFLSVFGKKIFLFGSVRTKSNSDYRYFMQEFDGNALSPVGERRQLSGRAINGKDSKVNYRFLISPDDSKAAFVVYDNVSSDYDIHMFDSDFSKVTSQKFTIPYHQAEFEPVSEFITNAGDFGIALITYKSQNRKDYNEHSYKVCLMRMGLPVEEYVLNTAGNYIHSIEVSDQGAKGKLQVFTLWSKNYSDVINGFAVGELSTTNKTVDFKIYKAFETDLLKAFENDDFATTKKNPGLTQFYLDKILTRDDGSADYVLEARRTARRQLTNGTLIETYTYGPLLDINVGKDLDKISLTRIPKDQHTDNGGTFMGSRAMAYGDKLVFFYLDHEDNINRSLDKKAFKTTTPKSMVLTMSTIDRQGQVTREPLFNCQEKDFLPYVADGTRLSKNEILFYGYGASMLSTGKINLLSITVK